MKRNSIKNSIRKVLLSSTIIVVLFVSLVTIILMSVLRYRTQEAVVSQMKENVSYIVDNKVEIAERELNKYKSYVNSMSNFINRIYRNSTSFKHNPVGQINKNIGHVLSLQRSMLNEDVNISSIEDEMNKIANIESFWNVLINSEKNTITSLYLGNESGFMLSYDKYANLAEVSNNGEAYFDFKSRQWYLEAKKAKDIVMVNLTQDYFGRGFTFTCAAPYYNDKNEFSGVVAMDILVSDLQKAIINIDYDKSSTDDYAFLIDFNGDIVASPFINENTVSFENISSENSLLYPIKDKILSGTTGIEFIDNAYIAFSPIKSADWVLCLHVPSDVVLKEVKYLNKVINRMVVIYILILITVILIAYNLSNRVSKRITAPLIKLTDDVKVISNGNLDQKAEITTNDEISDLANSFNSMTDSLKNYINDLTNLTAEKERIGAELNVATHIQSSMLPSIFPAFPHDARFDIYATMNPAKEVGGDFYDFFKIDEKHLAMVVADVSGKGIPAALFMVIGKTLIKDHTNLRTYLTDTFYEVNNMLCESNSENLFITAFEAVINVETGHMKYVNAGHEMPFICKKGKWKAEKIKPGFVLAGMENMKFAAGEMYLDKGDKFFQYTDGVTEATNINNELYGMERLENALNQNSDKSMRELLPAVKADIDKFVGEAPQFDDITMLGFELK